MSGDISCRALRPLFRYVSERGLSPADLVADLPHGPDPFDPGSWISADAFAQIMGRAADLLNDPDIAARAGEAAGRPCPFGPISPEDTLAGSPEALLAQAGTYLGLLQRTAQVAVRDCRPGKALVEVIPAPGDDLHPLIRTYAHHLLAAIPPLWAAAGTAVRESSGAGGRCTYEISWTVPRAGWPGRLLHLGPLSALRTSLFSRFRSQQGTIQKLRDEIRQLRQTSEARILERTEELRQKAHQTALVEQASRRFATLFEEDALAREAVRTLREDFNYFTAALYLRKGDGLVLQALHTGDTTVTAAPGQAFSISGGALDSLHRAGRPVVQDDLQIEGHPLQLPRLGRARSALTAALASSEQLLGVIDVQSPRESRFSDDDARTLYTLATQVASSLERGHLYRQEQRARQQADAMAILARMVNTSLDLDQVLTLALDELRRALPYDAAAVMLLEDGRPVPAASSGLPPRSAAVLEALFDPERHGALARTLQQAEPIHIADSAQGSFPPQLAILASWLALPLVSRSATMGAFLIAAQKPQQYTADDLRLAGDFAGQVATAIENARLYERIRRDRDHLEALYRIAQELNADVEIDELLRHILGSAQASVGATEGSIVLLEPDGQPSHSIVLRPSGESTEAIRQVLARGAAGWVVRSGQGLLVRDADVDPRWMVLPGQRRATRSAIVVPLLGQGQAIGVLTVTHPQAGHFADDDLDLLTSIAGQASSAVQRAALFTAIRGERARLEAVLEGTADAVIVLDEANRVLLVNRSAAGLFGLDLQGVVGQPLGTAVPHPAIEGLLRPQRKGRQRAEVPLSDGQTLYATLTPIPGVGAVITMQDISALKELDRMKSDFVANVSHDLRTPLGAVQGYAEMLELAGPMTEDQSRFAQRILHQVETMSHLVESLLDLAKIEAGVEMEMAPCQLAAVLAESVDQMSGPASLKAVQLRVAVPDDLPLVWGNGRRLGQVVNNLLDNAIKYTPGNSEVALRAGVAANEVRVDISDQGAGIAADDLPHLFEKFYRARKSGSGPRGTGLGLSIAHSIVTAHGGRIWAQSAAGRGSTFSFALPVGEERGQEMRRQEPGSAAGEGETKMDLSDPGI